MIKRLLTVAGLIALAGAFAANLPGLRPELNGFAAWTKVSTVRDTGGPHTGLSKVVFANTIAAEAWKKKGALPLGSIVVKTAGAVGNPTFVAVMLKQKTGWYYEEYFPKGGRYAVGAGGPGGQALCSNCHEDAANDFLFTRP
jgi:hypothetical protein